MFIVDLCIHVVVLTRERQIRVPTCHVHVDLLVLVPGKKVKIQLNQQLLDFFRKQG